MIEYLVYFIDFPPIQMAVVILMSASANARRREEEKKMLEEIKQHMPENMEIPSFLEDYYGISRELAQLGKELRGLHTGEEKKKLVADTMQKLIAQEKYRKEGDW